MFVVVERLRPDVMAPTIPDEVDKVSPDELILGMLGMVGNDDVNWEVSDGLKELVKPPDRLPDKPEDACMWLPTGEEKDPPRELPLVM